MCVHWGVLTCRVYTAILRTKDGCFYPPLRFWERFGQGGCVLKLPVWWLVGLLLFPVSALAAEKLCSSGGIYYCALKRSDPASDSLCGRSPFNAIIPGVNYVATGCGSSIYRLVSDWAYAYTIPATHLESLSGIVEHHYYRQLWDAPGWWSGKNSPATCIVGAQVRVYDCSPCQAPYAWDAKLNNCVTHCPASRPLLNTETGECEHDGPQQCEATGGNPVVIATGEKHQVEAPDYEAHGVFPLRFVRDYRSHRAPEAHAAYNAKYFNVNYAAPTGGKIYYQPEGYQAPASIVRRYIPWIEETDGVGNVSYRAPAAGHKQWSHNYHYQMVASATTPKAKLIRPDGQSLHFIREGDRYVSSQLSGRAIEPVMADGSITGWRYRPGQVTEYYAMDGRLTRLQLNPQVYQSLHYDAVGRLTQVSHSLGGTLDFGYNEQGFLSSVKPNGGSELELRYHFDDAGNMVEVVRHELGVTPAVRLRQYHYEDPRHPFALTGITDERGIRYVSWTYDVQGRAVESRSLDDVNAVQFAYDNEYRTTVTNPLGKQTIYHYTTHGQGKRLTKVEGVPSDNCAAAHQTYAYHSSGPYRGLMYRSMDWNGLYTDYTYNSRGLEIKRVEAVGKPESRTIETEWHPTEPWIVRRKTPSQMIEYDYDAEGRVLATRVKAR